MTTPAPHPAAQILNVSRVLGAETFRFDEMEATRPIRFCHFTTSHSTLKSRSFHRESLPLAAAGFDIRYVSPARGQTRYHNIEFIELPRRKSIIGRPLTGARLLIKLLRQRADIYHFQDPQLLPLGLLLKLIFRKRVIYDAYEDFPSMAVTKQSLPRIVRPLAAMTVAAAEFVAAQCFDAILTADPFTLRRTARTGRSRKLVFYNFPNLDFFPRPQPAEKRFDLVYRGGLSERAGSFILLDALHRLANEGRSVRLLLAGYSDSAADCHQLREQIVALGLNANVGLLGRIPHEEMAAALGSARIGICPLQDIPKFRLNIPVKIFEYWACGLPVIASDLPPSRPFMRGSGAGVLFSPGDSVALARAISHLLDQPDETKRMGERGRAIVEQRFNNGAEARKLISLCAKLAYKPASALVGGVQDA
jgi:hypothetical protein